MANILYLVHRLPYPPNKGDKVRSYHLLRHLQKRHRVFLGTFVDHPDDEAHVPVLQQMCPDLHVERLHATRAVHRRRGDGNGNGTLRRPVFRCRPSRQSS